MHVKILGPGCANCVNLEKNTRAAIASLGVEAEVSHVTDVAEIAAYGIMRTPGLVIDEEVVSSGRVLAPASIAELLAQR